MTHLVLARKWRPRLFEEVIGQESVTRTLQKSLVGNKLGHAYLFCGTRGIGKTSLARIFAKAIRCEDSTENGNPCLICSSCLEVDRSEGMNVIEIDGASHNSVEDVRKLIENVQYLPTNGTKKIYIIDEVHMLSTSAFNALLKTLEEPPEHIIFIFATTDPEKLLGTVISRCQKFDFKTASLAVIKNHLQTIGEKEGIKFQNDYVLHQIAKKGNGSFRDTLTALEQILAFSNSRDITEELLTLGLGVTQKDILNKIVMSILLGDDLNLKSAFDNALEANVDLEILYQGICEVVFDIIENLDNPEALKVMGFDAQKLSDFSFEELTWIFENLGKESQWILECIEPSLAFKLLLRKLARRRDVFSITEKISTEEKKRPKLTTSELKPEPKLETNPVSQELKPGLEKPEVKAEVAEIKMEKKVSHPKSWEGFLSFLSIKYPVLSTNMEQGNISDESVFKPQNFGLRFEVFFRPSARVFCDYLQEKANTDKIMNSLKEFWDTPELKISVTYKIDESREIKSVNEVHVEQEKIELDKEKTNFLESPVITQAENIFNTKITNHYHHNKK